LDRIANFTQLAQYDQIQPSGNAEQTAAPSIPDPNIVGQQPPPAENVTPQPSVENAQIKKEEKIEYRDQDGNLLNEDQLSSLEGKVSFQTRYETRTRVVDAQGNEVDEGPVGAEGFAPPHPDVDREPETAAEVDENDGREYPATASPEDDVGKEKSVERKDGGKPKPGSEAKEATA